MLLSSGGKVLIAYANKFAEIGHDVSIIAQKINRKNYKFNEKIVLFEVGGPFLKNQLKFFFLECDNPSLFALIYSYTPMSHFRLLVGNTVHYIPIQEMRLINK